ncbi:lipocalin-like domain-containing protein [Phocaeicola sp.]
MKAIKQILVCICLLLAVCGCDKKPINGKMDGRWQLMTIEYGDGNVEECYRIYYSIQLYQVEISNKGSNGKTFMGHFSYTDEVVMGEFRYLGNEEVQANEQDLKPFGLNEPVTHFQIEKLSRKKMILKSDYARLSFRKF